MHILIWNCQGTGKGDTIYTLQDALTEFSYVAICLLETKAKHLRINRLCRKLGFHQWYVIDQVCTSVGGMVFMWIAGIHVSCVFSNKGNIDLEVLDVS